MRRNLNIVLYSIILLTLLSCKKSFLEIPVQGQPTLATDPDIALQLVTGTYNTLLMGDAFGNGDIHGFSFVSATNIMSDDADKGSFAADQETTAGAFDVFTTLTPTNTFTASLWSGYYKGISAANHAIEALATANIDTGTRNKLIGEMVFIRGYYYFNLVRFYGKVPKILTVPKTAAEATNDPTFQTRASVDTIYNVIINDLQYAIDHLPLKSNASVGHITKGAAQTLLAKVYMYLKKWNECYNLTQEVINSGEYSLVPDYATIWRPEGDNNAESIFEVETGKYNNTDLGVQLYSECQGPRTGGKNGWLDLGWGFCTPSLSLINAYEPGDVRKDATIIFIDNSGNHTGTILFDGFRIPSSDSVQNLYYNYKALQSEESSQTFLGNRDYRQKNIHLLRYAEVLLINAEAANELGIGTPIDNLNEVRKRAHLPVTTAASKDDIRMAIWNERRVELALEHDRFWDLVRQGRVASVMQANGKTFKIGTNELLPVPSLQIALSNGKLSQNGDY